MLVLTIPFGGQSGVRIGDNIRVVAILPHYSPDGTQNGVKIGIDAPKDIPVVRDSAGRRTPRESPPLWVPTDESEV